MNINCPKCTHLYKNVSEENIGKKSKCIECRKNFIIKDTNLNPNILRLKHFLYVVSLFGLKKILIVLFILFGVLYFFTKGNITEETYTPNDNAQYAIVTLHGYGANGLDIMSVGTDVISFFGSDIKDDFSVYSPDAPYKISLGSQYSWTDRKINFEDSTNKIVEYIDDIHENKGIKYENIFLFGFSEGGAMVLHISDKIGGPLGGVIVVGSSLFYDDYDDNFTKSQSLYILAGDNDGFALSSDLKKTEDYLKGFLWDVKREIFQGLGHAVSEDEIKSIAKYIEGIILNRS